MCLGKHVFVWFAGVAFAASALASGALADDAVGALRVDVGTDGVAEFAMPFVPLPGIGPGAFLHGSFGSGEESPFDMLVRLGTAEDLEESAVWAFGTWLDPETWLPSVMSAAPGDEFLFFRSVGGPFSFTVFGIDPLRTSRRGVPASRSRAVAAPSSPDGKVAASPEGTPRLLPDQSSGAGIQPGLAAACYAFPGELAVFPDVSSLVPDATAVVSSLAEFQPGTDPSSPDTDSDGMPDAWEVSGGTCPFLDDALADPDGDGLVNAEEMRFQGREWSAATRLVNFRMRWYDSETGRWLSKDPIGIEGGFNLYVFCLDNPVQYCDPNGDVAPLLVPLTTELIKGAVACAVAAYGAYRIITANRNGGCGGGSGFSGERGRTSRPDGTPNPGKKFRPDGQGGWKYRDPNGKWKKKPPGFVPPQ